MFFGKADVVVTDGFTGNVFLKTCEGTVLFQLEAIKEGVHHSGIMSKLGALLMKPVFRKVHETLDYSAYGGAPCWVWKVVWLNVTVPQMAGPLLMG